MPWFTFGTKVFLKIKTKLTELKHPGQLQSECTDAQYSDMCKTCGAVQHLRSVITRARITLASPGIARKIPRFLLFPMVCSVSGQRFKMGVKTGSED